MTHRILYRYDQLTYPESGTSSKVSVEQLTEIMERVDLGYLVAMPGVLTDDINWEDQLSLGEKQRLAMARLIYHKPKFAILDECTSAVSGQMEYQLYEICKELKVTCGAMPPALQNLSRGTLVGGCPPPFPAITDCAP